MTSFPTVMTTRNVRVQSRYMPGIIMNQDKTNTGHTSTRLNRSSLLNHHPHNPHHCWRWRSTQVVKGTILPCSKLSFMPKLYVKRFSTFHWSCWSLFSQKYCVVCKKPTLKDLICFGFVTSFEDSHCILLFRYIYGAQLIQWFCYSKHPHVNCCSYQ